MPSRSLRRSDVTAVRVSSSWTCHAAPPCSSTTSSRSSISCSRTCTLSSSAVGQVLADVVGLDRQLAVAAVHQHDELNRLGPAEIDQRVERRARRAAGVEHVVHQQDLRVVDREGNLGAAHHRLRADRVPHQIVAVERDVERAGRHLVAGDLLDARGPGAWRCGTPRRAHADEREVVDAFVAFDDFVGDAGEGAADAVRIHDDGHVAPLCGLAGPQLKSDHHYILASMPVDVEARVISNTRLSPDYNVIALAAPEIARRHGARPVRDGQARPRRRSAAAPAVLGVRGAARQRPRRQASRCSASASASRPRMLFDAVEGDIVSCLGPLGKPVRARRPAGARRGWWPAASAWRRLPRSAEALVARGTPTTLFYGARSGKELFYLDWFASRGITLHAGHRGRHARRHAAASRVPLERELQQRRVGRRDGLRLRARADARSRGARGRALRARRRRCRWSA